MLTELNRHRYASLHAIGSLGNFPIVGSVLEQREIGCIYVDNKELPNVLFILHRSGFAYLYVNSYIDYEELMNFFVREKKVPEYFHIYDPPEGLTEYTSKNVTLGVKVRRRVQLRYQLHTIDTGIYKPQFHVSINKIALENLDHLAVFNLNLDRKFWNSKQQFLKEGFGIYLVNVNNEPMTLCYSAAVANNVAEVDIITRPQFQNLGLAKYAAAIFIEQGLQKSIQTNWDCFEDNISSLKTAFALGFEKIKDYNFLSLYTKNYEPIRS